MTGAARTSSAPDVTSNAITVGTISTQTGPLAGNARACDLRREGIFRLHQRPGRGERSQD